jgi:hypothetical protein
LRITAAATTPTPTTSIYSAIHHSEVSAANWIIATTTALATSKNVSIVSFSSSTTC